MPYPPVREDVIMALNHAIDRCEEGLLVKHPGSTYRPDKRKGEFCQTLPSEGISPQTCPEWGMIDLAFVGLCFWCLPAIMLGACWCVQITNPAHILPRSFASSWLFASRAVGQLLNLDRTASAPARLSKFFVLIVHTTCTCILYDKIHLKI